MSFKLNRQGWVERNFRNRYLKMLLKNLAKVSPSQKNEIRHEIEQLAVELAEENEVMIVDEAARTHLGMATLVLASYRVLLSQGKESELVINLLEDAFRGVGERWIKLYTRLMLRFSRDPFRKMMKVSKKQVIKNYGKTFTFEYSGDGRSYFVITTKKCFYHDFFVANDTPELTRVFCSGDKSWFEEINPNRHGFQFERPTTLGYGGAECSFYFKRVECRR